MRVAGKRLLPWGVPVVLVGLSIGWMVWLIPSDEQVVLRYLEDGEFARAGELLERMEASPGLGAEARGRLERLKLRVAVARAEATGERLSRKETEVLLGLLLEDVREGRLEPWQLSGVRLSESIPRPDGISAGAVSGLSPETRAQLRKTLVSSAQGAEQPGVAAAWSALFLELSEGSALLEASVALWRQAGQPGQALALVETYRQNDFGWDAARIDLLLELDRSSEAVDLILSRSAEDARYLEDHLSVKRAAQLAQLANRAEDLFPLFEEYLEAHPEAAWLREQLVDWKLAQSDLAGAEKILEQPMIELSPGEREQLARIYEWSGQPSRAFDVYIKLAEEGSKSALTRLLELNVGLMRGDEIADLVDALDFDQLDVAQKKALLALQSNQGLYAEGVETLDFLLANTPDDPELWLKRGHLFRVRLELGEAIRSYTQGLAAHPDDLALLRARGYTQVLAGAPGKAEDDFSRAYQLAGSVDDLDYLIDLNRTLGNWDLYYQLLEEAVQRSALVDPELYADLSRHYLRQGRYADTKKLLEKGLRAFPGNTVLLQSLVYSLDEMGQREAALVYFESYPALFQSREMRRMFVYLSTSLKHYEKVLGLVESGERELWLNDPETIASIAEAYRETGQLEKAYDLYQRAYLLDPQNDHAALRWASILEARGEEKAAKTLLKPFMPNLSTETLRNAAWFYADVNLYARAEMFLERFLAEAETVDARDWSFLGDIRLSMGDPSGAKRAYRRGARLMVAIDRYHADEIQRMAEALNPEDLKLLSYLMARLNRVQAAERLAEKVFELDPKHRKTHLALSSMYLENKEWQRVLETSIQLLKWYPNDEQALYFKAAAYQMSGQPLQAKEILRRIREDRYAGERFPYEVDFAAAARESGDWFRALQSYQRLLVLHDLSDELRQPVRDALDTIYRERMERLEWHPEATSQSDGWSVGSRVSVSAQLSERIRAGVFGSFRKVQLEESPVIEAADSTQAEAGVQFQVELSQSNSLELELGASEGLESAPVGHLVLSREMAPGFTVELGFDYRESSTDSTTLRSLDGRKTRFRLGAEHAIGSRWIVAGEISRDEVEVGAGVPWGRTLQASWSVGRRIQLNSPELLFQYVGYWSESSPDSFERSGLESLDFKSNNIAVEEALWDGLFPETIHNQGLNLIWSDRWLRVLHYELTAGVYYAFETKTVEYVAGGQLRFFPRKSIEVFTGLTYSSSTVSSPGGTDRVEWRFGLNHWF